MKYVCIVQSLRSDNVMTYVRCRLALCSVYVVDWVGNVAWDGSCAGLVETGWVGPDSVGTGRLGCGCAGWLGSA